MYNLTRVGAVNSTVEFVQNVNTELMNDWYGVLILITISVIVFMAFVYSTKNPVKAFGGASFIAFGISLFFVTINLIPVTAVYICVAAAALGIAFWNVD